MPVYSVSGPDGFIYDIEGPENANPNAILNAAKRFAREREITALQEKANAAKTAAYQPSASTEAPKTTFFGAGKELIKGIIPGAVGLGESAATGLAALLPDEQERAVRSAVSGAAAPVKEFFKPAPGYEESVPRKFSEAFGSTLPFLAAVPFTGGASLLGLGARAGIVGLGAAAGAGEQREMAEAAGASKDERAIATLLGAPVGLLDMLLPELRYGKTMITRAAVSGGVEGATETAQRIAQNAIAKYGYNPNQALLEGSGEEGAYGAGVGAVASLLMDAALGRKGKGVKPAAPTEEKPKEEKPLLLGNKPTPFTPVVFPDGSVATSPEDVAAYEKEHFKNKFSAAADQPAAPGIAGLLENKPFKPVVTPDGSVITTPEELKAYEEEKYHARRQQEEEAKQREEDAFRSKYAPVINQPGPAGLLENKPFTPIVYPDGSVATTPEQAKQLDESAYHQGRQQEEEAKQREEEALEANMHL